MANLLRLIAVLSGKLSGGFLIILAKFAINPFTHVLTWFKIMGAWWVIAEQEKT